MVIGLDASRANVAHPTGTERYAREVIVRLLNRLSAHTVRLYVREPLLPDWPSLPAHAQVRVLRWPPAILWSHIRLSWELLVHSPYVLFVPADTVPLIHPRRCVTTIHDVAFERFPELYRRKSIQRRMGLLKPIISGLVRLMTLGRYAATERDYHRWSVRQAIRTCNRILTVSEFSKREIQETLGVAPERIVVTPLGIRQPEYFASLPSELRPMILQRLGVQKPYVLFIGRLEAKKNIELLVRAYQQYRTFASDPVDLVLIGQPGFGWEKVEVSFDSEVSRQGIHQLGWQDDSTTDAILTGARAFIFISHYEGFGIPALEAMSAGVPVLASRNGSLPEVLGDAASYVSTDLSSVAHGLQTITEDQMLREQCRERGYARVRQYTWERTTDLTLPLLVN